MQQKTSIFITVTTAILLAVVFLVRGKPDNLPSTLATESIPPDEASDIKRIVSLLQAQGDNRKYHGCLQGSFQVISNLDPGLQTALFRPGAIYPTRISFWGRNKHTPDSEPGVQHLALKLSNVPGEKFTGQEAAHDLVLTSHPVFPFADVKTYAGAINAFSDNRPLSFFFNPLQPRLKAFRIHKAMATRHRDLLATRWWSALPYRYGADRAVKYSLRPCARSAARQTNYGQGFTANFLHERLRESLAGGSGCYEFMVQFQTDPKTMPIEDPTVYWDETIAPFQPIARLTIPAQAVAAPTNETCGELFFNPWRALSAHQPLGGINRARRRILSEAEGRGGNKNAARAETATPASASSAFE